MTVPRAAICQVTRVFRDEDVTHVDGKVDPDSDISTIQTELILADLETVEKALPRLEKEARMKAVENHKKWLDAAKFLGCHCIRVNAYGIA